MSSSQRNNSKLAQRRARKQAGRARAGNRMVASWDVPAAAPRFSGLTASEVRAVCELTTQEVHRQSQRGGAGNKDAVVTDNDADTIDGHGGRDSMRAADVARLLAQLRVPDTRAMIIGEMEEGTA